jgi:alpha-beta hydrolase superfamily lysophospholipase
VTTRSLTDGGESFTATVFEPASPVRTVLFAVGGGGNPERHLPLLAALSERGCTVVAPHFARIVSPRPTEEELLGRARRLRVALDAVAPPGLPVAGVGHSIGAMLLVALAGGQAWMRVGRQLAVAADPRLDRLALMAPATGFFQAPEALDGVRTPILVWAGADDPIAPPSQAQFLKQELGDRVPVDLRVLAGVGHFTFMNVLPPQVTDPLPDREAFLARLAAEVCGFVTG